MRLKKEQLQSGKRSATHKNLTPEMIAAEVAKEFNPVRFVAEALKKVSKE